jgi:hypothetical protein
LAESASQILKRWTELVNERRYYEALWQDISEFVIPYKSTILRKLSPGTKKTARLFDATAIHSAQLLAASLHGTLTPTTQPWLSLKVRQEELNEIKAVRDWFEDCARRMHLALRQSNFATSVHEMYLDLVGPSATGCLFVEEKDPTATGAFRGLRFRAHSPGEYAIAEDADGLADTLFRSLKMPVRAIVQKWPTTVTDRIEQEARTKPDARREVVHAIYPRTDYNVKARGGRNMPWASCYVLVDEKKKLDEGGYQEFPFMVPRWAKNSDEIYGSGPSHTAYPDVKSLNAAKEFVLKAAPLAMQPPTVERDGSLEGDPDLTPGGRNVVNGSGPLADHFGFMDTKNRPDLSQLVLNDLQQGVRRMYYTDQLQLQESPQMTATEVQVRYELMQRLLGPSLSRQESEFLNPLVARVFAIMARARAFLPAPMELVQAMRIENADAPDIDVEYEGPMARAQRTIELTAQERVTGFVAQVAQAKSQFPTQEWDVLDTDQMIRDRAEITGLSSKSVRDDDAVKGIREDRKQQEAEKAKLQQMEQMATMAGKAAPALKAIQGAQQPQGAAA